MLEATYPSSTWTFATSEERAWWGDLWAERCLASAFGTQAQDYGLATAHELQDVAAGWRAWAAHPDAAFVVVHGEIVARV